MTIPRHLPYAKYDSDGSVYCIVDDWDFGDYNATWHYHMIITHPDMKFTEDGES